VSRAIFCHVSTLTTKPLLRPATGDRGPRPHSTRRPSAPACEPLRQGDPAFVVAAGRVRLRRPRSILFTKRRPIACMLRCGCLCQSAPRERTPTGRSEVRGAWMSAQSAPRCARPRWTILRTMHYHALANFGLITKAAIAEMSDRDLLRFPRLGPTAVATIKRERVRATSSVWRSRESRDRSR
jgi:hypothetical protein